jgi:hypothetical protein
MPFSLWVGRQCDAFIQGFYDEILASQKASGDQVTYTDQVPISASEAGKRVINEALGSVDACKVINTIDKVCSQENLSKVTCVNAIYYCSKVVLASASEAIRGNCINLLV